MTEFNLYTADNRMPVTYHSVLVRACDEFDHVAGFYGPRNPQETALCDHINARLKNICNSHLSIADIRRIEKRNGF